MIFFGLIYLLINEKMIFQSIELYLYYRDIPAILHSDNLLRSSNVHLLRGIVNLGKLLQKNTDVKDCMSPEHVFHT